MSSSRNILAKDRFDQPVFLFENDFALRWFADKYPDVELEEKMGLRYQQLELKFLIVGRWVAIWRTS